MLETQSIQKKALYEKRFRERFKDSKSIIISYISGSRNATVKGPKVKFICHQCNQETEINYRVERHKGDLLCNSCSQKNKVDQKREGTQLSVECIKEKFREAGAIPTFKDYKNAYDPLSFICKCGNLGETTAAVLNYDKREPLCKACIKKKRIESGKKNAKFLLHDFKYDTEEVKSLFIEYGAIPLFEGDINVKQRLPFRCSCGKEYFTTLSQFNFHRKKEGFKLQCRSCVTTISKKVMAQKHFNERIKPYFKEKGVELLTTEYKNQNTRLKFICKCGNTYDVTWGSISSGSSDKNKWKEIRCSECILKARPRGENHPSWKSYLTDEDRRKSKYGRGNNAAVWTRRNLQLNKYTCCISRQWGGDLAIHHVNAYAKFKDQQYVLNNGACITRELHEEFHNIYGMKNGDNTLEQFQEFYRSKTGQEYVPLIPNSIYIEFIEQTMHSNTLIQKKRSLNEEGIRYIPFFFSEVILKPKIVLGMIQSRIKNISNKLYARKLKVKRITDFSKVSHFLNENHIQGSCPVGLNLALVDDQDNIKSLMCFKKRFSFGQDHYSLDRFCSLLNTVVVGGASKLFKYFIREYDPIEVVSYGDLRFSSYNSEETVYHKLGFKYTHTSSPNYWYTNDGINLYFRRTFQKKNLSKFFNKDIDLSLTEREIMEQEGYTRLYDCGNQVFVWNKSN